MKIRRRLAATPFTLPLTPMIDIIFQLLIFFVMTFRIVALEGDFDISTAGAGGPPLVVSDLQVPALVVRLEADLAGGLNRLTVNGRPCADFEHLRGESLAYVAALGSDGDKNSAAAEVQADANLNYHHLIDAMTALSGYKDDEGRIVPLIETIKFAPPQPTATP